MRYEAILPACAIALAIGCGDSPRETPPASTGSASPSHLELAIAKQLSDKLGRVVRVSCTPPRCTADLGDAKLPIEVGSGSDGWSWNVIGLLVRSAPIETYLRDELVDLGAQQAVHCGPAIRSVAADDRIECTLERGGKAFATVHADGTFTTEIALDPGVAAARSQAPAGTLERTGSAAGSSSSPDDDD